MRKFYLLCLAGCFGLKVSHAQFTVTNNASVISTSPTESCFQLTPNDFYQKGAVWSNNTIDLTKNFEVNAKLYFGIGESGADGIAFVLQNEGTSYIGNHGAGIGYHRFNGTFPSMFPADVPGPVPSFIVEFDTYQNGIIGNENVGDPLEDHVGFMSHSNAYHTSPTALKPYEILNANVEDNQWHDVKFTWNAGTKTMTVEFVLSVVPLTKQTFVYTGDIVANIFGGNSNVHWGFTSSTGSYVPTVQSVCIQTPPPPPPGDCGQLRTQTPGGWGAKPAGNNPGAYLHANFAAAFPGGLTIGSLFKHNIRLTTAQAVTNFLPCGGKAQALTTSYINPADKTIKNTLAGHLAALTLSVTFDQHDPNFGQAGIVLGDMVIGSGPFYGWNVVDFLAEANRILGGENSSFSVQDALSTANDINENYVDGKKDKNYLKCPNEVAGRRGGNQPAQTVANIPVAGTFNIYPTVTSGLVNVRFEGTEGRATIQLMNINGSLVATKNVAVQNAGQTFQFDLSGQAKGMYLIRVNTANGTSVQKVIRQ